jgi:hypothetical protein
MKLDVEGHEFPALEGLTKILHSPSLRVVVFEDSPARNTVVKMLLKEAGFRYEPLRELQTPTEELCCPLVDWCPELVSASQTNRGLEGSLWSTAVPMRLPKEWHGIPTPLSPT